MSSRPIGSFGWVDLTIPECDAIRLFYERLVGWTSQPIEMEGYSDYRMIIGIGIVQNPDPMPVQIRPLTTRA